MISVTYPYRELGFKLIHDVRRKGPCNVSSWLSVPCFNGGSDWDYRLLKVLRLCYVIFQVGPIGISIIKIRYQYHKTQVYRSTCKMTSLYWDELQGAQFMNDFPILILIRWKLDFKCNFIVGNHIATKFCTTAVPCAKFHNDHFTQSRIWTTWYFHRIWITTEKSWIDSCWLALVFGMGLPQIIAVRKHFVDIMRNYVIIYLVHPMLCVNTI